MDLFIIIYSLVVTFAFAGSAEFIINLEELRPDQLTTLRYSNLSVVEGDQAVMMIITGLNYYLPGNCTAVCDINRIANISDSSCNVVNASIGQRNQINMLLDSFTVTESHNGPWDCNFDLPPKQPATERQKLKLPLSVTVTQKESSNDSKLVYYLSAAGVLVVLIIIGQTICILYFKSKARKAGIAKNLTPKNSTHENATEMRERYVTKSTGPPEVRDSLYEALDTVGGLAPPPPPLSTLPVTPKLTMARSVLQKNLSAKPDGFKTTPHPLPKNPQNQQKQRKFNTLDRCSSLERIRNRPPLPIPAEIYEVMVTEESPVIQKTSRFESNNTQERTPLIKKPYIGKHKSSPSDGATGRVPNSPALGRKPGAGFPSKPAPEQLPVPSGRPFGPSVLQKPPTGAKPGMRALPVLPSMITAANLKPVKQFGGPPASANPKISPKLDSLKKPATNPRPLPSRLQPPLPIAPEANTITRSKPPMPLPALITPEPELIPTEDPECYDSSSDDEFKCYDDLAEYRIYGNTQPKKFK